MLYMEPGAPAQADRTVHISLDLSRPLGILFGISFAMYAGAFTLSLFGNRPGATHVSWLALGTSSIFIGAFGLLWAFAPRRVERWRAYIERERQRRGIAPPARWAILLITAPLGLGGLAEAFDQAGVHLVGALLWLLAVLAMLAAWREGVGRTLRPTSLDGSPPGE